MARGSSGGGGSGNPMDCLGGLIGGGGSAPADPMCLGGNSCNTMMNCISGKPGGTCGSGMGFP